MSYHKPTLRPLNMNVDVASCKPCPRGTIPLLGLCLATRQAIYVQGPRAAAAESSPPLPELALPGPAGVDAVLVLP